MKYTLFASAALALLTACGTNYDRVQTAAARANHDASTRGLECDFMPYPACDGWRAGGTASAHGGSFPFDKDLKISCAAWHVKYQNVLKQEGVESWNVYAAKHGKPNDGSCNLDVTSAPAALADEKAPAQFTVVPGL